MVEKATLLENPILVALMLDGYAGEKHRSMILSFIFADVLFWCEEFGFGLEAIIQIVIAKY